MSPNPELLLVPKGKNTKFFQRLLLLVAKIPSLRSQIAKIPWLAMDCPSKASGAQFLAVPKVWSGGLRAEDVKELMLSQPFGRVVLVKSFLL